jgi:hypothetical protein
MLDAHDVWGEHVEVAGQRPLDDDRERRRRPRATRSRSSVASWAPPTRETAPKQRIGRRRGERSYFPLPPRGPPPPPPRRPAAIASGIPTTSAVRSPSGCSRAATSRTPSQSSHFIAVVIAAPTRRCSVFHRSSMSAKGVDGDLVTWLANPGFGGRRVRADLDLVTGGSLRVGLWGEPSVRPVH